MSKRFTLTVEYAGYDREIEDAIEEELGFSDGSGFGFGVRDHSWDVGNKKELNSLKKKAKKLSKQFPDVKFTISDSEWDDEEDY